MLNYRKGQSGLEYLILTGLILTILIPMFIYSLQLSEESLRAAKAKEAMQRIEQTIDELEKMGGGKASFFIELPEGIENYTISNNFIGYKVKSGDATSTAFHIAKNNITGSLPTESGYHKMVVEVFDNVTIINPVFNATTTTSSTTTTSTTSSTTTSITTTSTTTSSTTTSSTTTSITTTTITSTTITSSTTTTTTTTTSSTTTITLPPSYSCESYCIYIGYLTGVCRQEIPKCAQNGETYEQKGDKYCRGGAQSDTCCCVSHT